MATMTVTRPFCDCTRPIECTDRHRGRYLTAIHWLTSHEEERVQTGEISDRLSVGPSTGTEMSKKLTAEGLVDYEKHRGCTLTEDGDAVARELVWRQCLVRIFFATELDFEAEANVSYHVGYLLSNEGIDRFHELVGHSSHDCSRVVTGGSER